MEPSTVNWTNAYLQWSDKDACDIGVDPPESPVEEANAALVEKFAEAYLEWLEAA